MNMRKNVIMKENNNPPYCAPNKDFKKGLNIAINSKPKHPAKSLNNLL